MFKIFKRYLEKDNSLAATLNGAHYICFPLYFDVYKSRTIISRFSKRWMICNDDVECILTTLNDLYYAEWFVPSWIFCICNFEFVLTILKDLRCCSMIWMVQWNFLLENIPWNIVSEFSLPWKSQPCSLPNEKIPVVETPPVLITLQQMKIQTVFKI